MLKEKSIYVKVFVMTKKYLRSVRDYFYQIKMSIKSFFAKGWIVYKSNKLNLTLLLNLSSYIDFCIYANDQYDIDSLEKLADCIQRLKKINSNNNWFIDIGSNIGLMSIFLKKIYPDLMIDAFEPIEQNFCQNKINQKINELEFNLYKVALSDIFIKDAEILLNDSPINIEYNKYNMGMASFYKNRHRTGKRIEICQAYSFDFFLRTHKSLNYQDHKNIIIKLDVEGAELVVLQGMLEFLDSIKSQIVIIFIELLFEENFDQCVHTVNFLKKQSFKFHNMKFEKIITNDFRSFRSGNFIFTHNF